MGLPSRLGHAREYSGRGDVAETHQSGPSRDGIGIHLDGLSSSAAGQAVICRDDVILHDVNDGALHLEIDAVLQAELTRDNLHVAGRRVRGRGRWAIDRRRSA